MNDDRWAFPPQPPAWPPAPSTTPPRRTSRTLAAIAVFLATGIVAAGIGVGGVLLLRHVQSQSTSNPPTAAPGSSGAAQARATYQQARTATGASAGFHYVAVSTGGDAQTIVGDAGQANGRQAITFVSSFGTEQFTLLLVSGTVYFQGNTPAVEDQLGVTPATAAADVGKWVLVKSTDGPYHVLQPGITTSSQATELTLTPESLSTVTAGGVSATKISGITPATPTVPAGSASLIVASSSDLPISYASTVATLSFTTTFSGWGNAPSVSAPAGAVAWSTLTTAVPAGGFGSGGVPGSAPTPTPTPGAI